MRVTTVLVTALACLSAHGVLAQQLEHTPRPAGEHPAGYLNGVVIDYSQIIGPPPAEGSLQDTIDVVAVKTLQATATLERWAVAEGDNAYVYPEFEEAFGGPIDRQHTPKLIYLLNNAIHDVGPPTWAAKKAFGRRRPYQRWQVSRACGEATPPPPTADPDERSSYPSGHTAYGWTAALVLAMVAPERSQSILARADDYGLSREICGMHFPTDVAAAHALATAVVTRLAATPEFQKDLTAAQAEHQQAVTAQ